MKQYVIYLISDNSYGNINAYGYWTGKSYIVQGNLFPVTTDGIDDAKRYTSLKRAENALEKCLSRGYTYVVDGQVEEV